MSWHVFEVVIPKDVPRGRGVYPAGVWSRVCYREIAQGIVDRLALAGVPALIRYAGMETA